jgi:hypothetical protein
VIEYLEMPQMEERGTDAYRRVAYPNLCRQAGLVRDEGELRPSTLIEGLLYNQLATVPRR